MSEDEIRKTTRIAVDVAKARARSRNSVDVKLVPVPAYTDYWAVPIKRDPFQVPSTRRSLFSMKVNEAVLKNKDVFACSRRWRSITSGAYLATSRLVHRAGSLAHVPGFNAIARKGRSVKSRTFNVPPRTGGYEIVENSQMLENAERIAAEAVEHAGAPPVQAGVKDRGRTPSHAMLTIHEIITHPTELDRVLGYEKRTTRAPASSSSPTSGS